MITCICHCNPHMTHHMQSSHGSRLTVPCIIVRKVCFAPSCLYMFMRDKQVTVCHVGLLDNTPVWLSLSLAAIMPVLFCLIFTTAKLFLLSVLNSHSSKSKRKTLLLHLSSVWPALTRCESVDWPLLSYPCCLLEFISFQSFLWDLFNGQRVVRVFS